MAQTPPVAPDALPTAPNTSVPAGFSATMDAFLAALVVFRTQVAALGTNMYNNCVDAAASAAAALGYSNAASTSANLAAASATAATVAGNAVLWVSGASIAQNASVISPLTSATYRRKTATGSGTTDPSADPTNYALISNFAYVQTADQTITSGGLLTIAHGLGRVPVRVTPYLKNITADLGYAVGDITETSTAPVWNGGSAFCGCAITCDATNVYVRFSSLANAFYLINKTTGGGSSPATNSNWSFFLRVSA